MLLVLDESGRDGLKQPPGMSPWLVIAGVLFVTREDSVACRAALIALRQTLGGKEFRFSKNTDRRRRAVLEFLAARPLTYFAAACDRSRINHRRWKKPIDLYRGLAGHLIGQLAPHLAGCTAWFDTLGKGDVDREYGKHLCRSSGRDGHGRCRITDTRAFDSDREPLIQVADYVCGAVAHHLKSGQQNEDYYRLIRKREGGMFFWPEPLVTKGEKESGPDNQPAPEWPPLDTESSRSGERPFKNDS